MAQLSFTLRSMQERNMQIVIRTSLRAAGYFEVPDSTHCMLVSSPLLLHAHLFAPITMVYFQSILQSKQCI